MNDFGQWLEDNEISASDVKVGSDPVDAPNAAHQDSNGQWVEAKWKRVETNHKCMACDGRGIWSPAVFATYAKPGKCFKCQGRGHFKTSHAERCKARAYRKLTTANKLESAKAEIQEQHNELIEWLKANTSWNDFARSLIDQFDRKGSLSEKQIAAAERMKAKMDAKDEAKKAANAVESAGNGLDLSQLPAGRYAVPDGDTRLKIRVNRPKQGNWKGYIFVDDGAEYGMRQNYGRQAPGGLYNGKVMDQLEVILADPKAAAVAYGRLTGQCCICNRLLEDEQSVAAGIGPVCAKKF